MKRFVTLKSCFGVAAVLLFAALVVYLPNPKAGDGRYDRYFGPAVSEASVVHEIFGGAGLSLQQLNGVKILNRDTGRYTYYFEYIANKQDTLRRVAALPFLKDNRPASLMCELMYASFNPLENPALTDEEKNTAAFFWEAQAEDFVFYECYRSPVKHTLLLSKTSDRILHRVEFV